LIQIVQTGSKNIEIAVMGLDTELVILEPEQVDAVAALIEQENAAEAEKKAKRPGRSSEES
jgi:20S proteasome subunit alpha 4